MNINKYISDFYKFLRIKGSRKISFNKLIVYVLFVTLLVIIGQLSVSETYKFENNKNKKFIKDEIKNQIITDTIHLKSTYNSEMFFVIKIDNNLDYYIYLENETNLDKITINAKIQKKVNDKNFEIVNNDLKYKFTIKDFSNHVMLPFRVFVLLGTLVMSLIFIPLWLNQNSKDKSN